MSVPNALITALLPVDDVTDTVGNEVYWLPPFVKKKSVICCKSVNFSCTNTLPSYGSPEVVSSSKTILSPVDIPVPFSPEKPPFTILTNPAAFLPFVPVFVKDKLSPILYPVPALSITISVTEPGPISSTWNKAPSPPAVRDIVSVVEFSEPSLVIFLVPGIPVILALIK